MWVQTRKLVGAAGCVGAKAHLGYQERWIATTIVPSAEPRPPAKICRAVTTAQEYVTSGPVRCEFHLRYEGRWIATIMSSDHLCRGLPHK
jgi:hypothetical protein